MRRSSFSAPFRKARVDPVGGRKTVKVDIRLVSASNKDLLECVRQNGSARTFITASTSSPSPFRPCATGVRTSPRWCAASLRGSRRKRGRTIRGISGEAMQLQSFHWPGNVRQLENTMFRAVILCEGDEITLDHCRRLHRW